MRTVTVELGGKKYEVCEKRTRENEAWRKKVSGPFGQLVSVIQGLPNAEFTPAYVADLLSNVSGLLLGSVDLLKELLFEYSPELAADRERIEEECYDFEILAAFVEVLKLAFPFGGLVEAFSGARSQAKIAGRQPKRVK